MSIKETIFRGIQNKIESMIQDNKFNLYQLKYFPMLYRGTESGPYQNSILPISYNPVFDGYDYRFTYYYFFERNQTPEESFRVTLNMKSFDDFDDVDIRIKFGDSYFLGFTFEYEKLLRKGYSVDDILDEFENVFLELPFCGQGAFTRHLQFRPKWYLEENYDQIATAYHNKKIEDRSLAIAMFSHNRLAGNGLTRALPPELLSKIAEYSFQAPNN